jgi:hypothetical protein
MKTLIKILSIRITLIIAAFFGAGIISLFAASSVDGPDCITPACLENSFLAPKTPAEADFNDDDVTLIDFNTLVPVTPKEAEFNDDDVFIIDFTILAPVTPREAEFEGDDGSYLIIYKMLAPVTPKEARFDEED